MKKEIVFVVVVVLTIILLYNISTPQYHQKKFVQLVATNQSIYTSQPLNIQSYSLYNEDLSQYLYFYSKVTYCKEDQIANWTCASCPLVPKLDEMHLIYDKQLGLLGLCGHDPINNFNIFAFRGSISKINMKEDAEFFLSEYKLNECPKCKVHKSFQQIFLNIEQDVLYCANLLKNQYPTAEYAITGHSLGAALATFSAIQIQLKVQPLKFFYNFGAPRLGNKNFVEFFDLENITNSTFVSRVTHWQDPIPHLPPSWTGFENYRNEDFYNQNWTSHIQCDEGNDNQCADQFKMPYHWNIKDHLFYFNLCAGCQESNCDRMYNEYESFIPKLRNPFHKYE